MSWSVSRGRSVPPVPWNSTAPFWPSTTRRRQGASAGARNDPMFPGQKASGPSGRTNEALRAPVRHVRADGTL